MTPVLIDGNMESVWNVEDNIEQRSLEDITQNCREEEEDLVWVSQWAEVAAAGTR